MVAGCPWWRAVSGQVVTRGRLSLVVGCLGADCFGRVVTGAGCHWGGLFGGAMSLHPKKDDCKVTSMVFCSQQDAFNFNTQLSLVLGGKRTLFEPEMLILMSFLLLSHNFLKKLIT